MSPGLSPVLNLLPVGADIAAHTTLRHRGISVGGCYYKTKSKLAPKPTLIEGLGKERDD